MWKNLLSEKRFHEEKEEFNYRTNFHRDYDRVLFSSSFRRLSRKTQVHPLAKNDNVHNRLTHSYGVASIGRSLGISIGEFIKDKVDFEIDPSDFSFIVQTACLAHDIGNPPFGHAGEEVIKEWFKENENELCLSELTKHELNDFQNLDGNAQSFRVVTQLEHNPFFGGMRLTHATLGSLVKYTHSSNFCKDIRKSKFNYFKSEEDIFHKLFSELKLIKKDGTYKRHPLSYLVEVSDDICYGLLDLQDGFELNLLEFEDVRYVFELLCGEKCIDTIYKNKSNNESVKFEKLVANAINNLTVEAMNSFKSGYEKIISDNQPKDLLEIFENENYKMGLEKAKKYTQQEIFNEQKKIELELGAYCIIEILLDTLIKATYSLYKNDYEKLSFKDKRALALMGELVPQKSNSLYNMYQRVIDYIVSMTDNHAQYIANQLNGEGYS